MAMWYGKPYSITSTFLSEVLISEKQLYGLLSLSDSLLKSQETAGMPIAEHFKRGFKSIKGSFVDRSGHLEEHPRAVASLIATIPVILPVENGDRSGLQDVKEAARKQGQISDDGQAGSSIASLTTKSEHSHLSSENNFWFQASERLKSDDPVLVSKVIVPLYTEQ